MAKPHDDESLDRLEQRIRWRPRLFAVCWVLASGALAQTGDGKNQPVAPSPPTPGSATTIRTENYPRPPYSGATYYIYERNGQVICTKLEVCNKYDQCETSYTKGSFKDDEDVQTGAPYQSTPAQVLPPEKLKKHVCLEKFHLN